MILAFSHYGIGYACPAFIAPEYLLSPSPEKIPIYRPSIMLGRYYHEAVKAQSIIKTDQSHSIGRARPALLEDAIDILFPSYDLCLSKASSHRLP